MWVYLVYSGSVTSGVVICDVTGQQLLSQAAVLSMTVGFIRPNYEGYPESEDTKPVEVVGKKQVSGWQYYRVVGIGEEVINFQVLCRHFCARCCYLK